MPIYWNLDILSGCAMTFYAYQCQVQLLPIYSELQKPVYNRIAKVINRATLINFGFYLVIAISGYISSFNDTAKIVLERITIDGLPDYACLVAVFGVVISI